LTALVAGSAAGAAIAGALAQHQGWRLAVVVGVAVAALGTVLAQTRRRVLQAHTA
jgi:MFS family permease